MASSFPTLSTIMEAESDSAVTHALALALDANEGEDLVDNVDNVNALAQEVISIYAAIEAANRADDPFGRPGICQERCLDYSSHKEGRQGRHEHVLIQRRPRFRPRALSSHPWAPSRACCDGLWPSPSISTPRILPPAIPITLLSLSLPGLGPPRPLLATPSCRSVCSRHSGAHPAAQAAPPPPPPPAGPVLSSKAQGKAAVKVRVTADNEYVPPLSEDAMKKTFSPTSWLPAAFVPSKGKKSSSKASTMAPALSSGALADLYDVELWVGRLQSLGIEGSHEQLTTIAQNVVQYLFEMLKDIVCI
ncbi:hypothetical protein FA13DRAFT_1715906 [Coprinellus micaceus]|uniref:Uncharacterized protein n=1 Tax=Coprinellus micaceus TaxID=71717 RepID=A0A4Y7SL27_COPMI|nr:hypothetical protein FA13DRAFT_1715906 [Coprinellus micaceus]